MLLGIKFQSILLLSLLFVGCAKSNDVYRSKTNSKTAVFVYMIADNDLDYFAIQNINELEKGLYNSHNKDQSIYVYLDRLNNNPVLYNIIPDTTSLVHSTIEYAYPEMNSSDKDTFKSILEDVISLTKSKDEYLKGLILWSHGSSWLPEGNFLTFSAKNSSLRDKFLLRSFGLDESIAGENIHEMSLLDLSQALKDFHFDFLIFDACFMGGIEVSYELKKSFDYIIASPTEILATGFPYEDIVPILSTKQIDYKKVCDAYIKYYEAKKTPLNSATISLINTAGLEKFAKEFKRTMNKRLLNKLPENILQYELSNSNILFDLNSVINLVEDVNDRTGLLNCVSDVVQYYKHTGFFYNRIPLSETSGLSIFIPNKSIKNESVEIQFFKKTSWAKDCGLCDFYPYF